MAPPGSRGTTVLPEEPSGGYPWWFYLAAMLVPVAFVAAAFTGALGPGFRLDGTIDAVAVVHVTVEISAWATNTSEGASRADPIFLPHCSAAWLDGNRLFWQGDGYDTAASVVVVIDYRGQGSFSGGGDDRLVQLMGPGEEFAVRPAAVGSPPLYRIVADRAVTVIPDSATPTRGDRFQISYNVTGPNNLFRWDVRSDNVTVEEVHDIVTRYDMRVVQQPPAMCM